MCQAEGISAAAAVRRMLAGGPLAGARALYNGIGAAALCSIIVGSVHYASFCMSKRAAVAAAEGGGKGGKGGKGGGSGDEDGGSPGAATAFAAVVGAIATALVESPCDLYRHQAQAGMIQGNFLSEVRLAGEAGVGFWVERQRALNVNESRGRNPNDPPTNTPPPKMASAVRRDGPGALYYGLFAFMMESLPYDIMELVGVGGGGGWRARGKQAEGTPSNTAHRQHTHKRIHLPSSSPSPLFQGTYGYLNDWRDASLKRDDAMGKKVAAVPSHVSGL